MPTHIYIVVDGDFEILRQKKNKYLLIDPTNTDGKKGKIISRDKIDSLLGPGK